MSNPAGWYPTPDGQQRYWDGAQWTDNVAPGAPIVGPPPSSSNGWLKGCLIAAGIGLFILFAIGACMAISAANADVKSSPSPSASRMVERATPEASPTATASVGQPVRDGKFEFTVSGVECGITQVGNEYLNTKPQGQFCAVAMTVTNISDKPQFMFTDNQYGWDAQGRKFSADSKAGIYAQDGDLLFNEINPGNSVTGRVYFDVPADVKLVKVTLHDSLMSGGVEVALP